MFRQYTHNFIFERDLPENVKSFFLMVKLIQRKSLIPRR